MLVTAHWSASGPSPLHDYHVEFAARDTMSADLRNALRAKEHASDVDFDAIRVLFDVWKNDDLGTPTDYGTWHLNHDPRDGSANVEIGAMCMANATTTNWGRYPFTIAHAWMMAALAARVCELKKIDANGSFPTSVEPDVLMNGPIFNVSTHAERAIQTRNPGVSRPELGYFIFSGDPDCRWDIAVTDPGDVGMLSTPAGARSAAIASAAWLRERVHEIKAAGITDFWGLDK